MVAADLSSGATASHFLAFFARVFACQRIIFLDVPLVGSGVLSSFGVTGPHYWAPLSVFFYLVYVAGDEIQSCRKGAGHAVDLRVSTLQELYLLFWISSHSGSFITLLAYFLAW